ncbi:potassium channel, putative [Entamoeba invadens IP1]|uniref:potassium channel, putative n=1 Tax=Entamoeba invadens IP1 TaxID=370355 RepID=UPI0002C3F562|nr:potassium channel, putative [Entamoeba invadens IP1]ELP93287.1 potassium channel, putative [Entamoeba invadens IP1]|eukprot:XP_004260058.1 potassium channel, putative [Entamoeba invadens IP1]
MKEIIVDNEQSSSPDTEPVSPKVLEVYTKPNKIRAFQKFTKKCRTSIYTKYLVLTDLLLNILICILYCGETYVVGDDKLWTFVDIEVALSLYLFFTMIYLNLIKLTILERIVDLNMIINVITAIPLFYFVFASKSILYPWRSHVYGFGFLRIVLVVDLFVPVSELFWTGNSVRRYQIISKSIRMLLTIFCVMYISSYLIYLLEGESIESKYHEYHNCFYFTIVTMTTIGFGDITPQTFEGKILAICTIFVTIIILPIQTKSILDIVSQPTRPSKVKTINYVLYSGDVRMFSLFDKNIKKEIVALFDGNNWKKLLVGNVKNYYIEGNPIKKEDLELCDIKSAKRSLVVSDGDDYMAFLKCKSIKMANPSLNQFVYLKSNRLSKSFQAMGIDVLCEDYAQQLMVGEVCVPNFIDLMLTLFSVDEKIRKLYGVVRSMPVPECFIGLKVEAVTLALIREADSILVGVKMEDVIYYTDAPRTLRIEDVMFVLGNDKCIDLILDKTDNHSRGFFNIESIQVEDGTEEPVFVKVKNLKKTMIGEYNGENHLLLVGFHNNTVSLVEKLREKEESDIVIFVENLKDVTKEWPILSNIRKLYVMQGNPLKVGDLDRANIRRAKSICVIPSKSKNFDDAEVIIVSETINSIINGLVPVVVEMDDLENERFVKKYASVYSRYMIVPMICHMIKNKYCATLWTDFLHLTGNVSVVKFNIQQNWSGMAFADVFSSLLSKGLKCLGVVRKFGDETVVVAEDDLILDISDQIFCIGKIKTIAKLEEKTGIKPLCISQIRDIKSSSSAIPELMEEA